MTLDEFEQRLMRLYTLNYTRKGSSFEISDTYLTDPDVKALPEGMVLSAHGGIYFGNLRALGKGVSLSAGGSLYLGSLRILSEGVALSAGGAVHLPSLTSEVQTYQGQTIRLRTIDGICTRLIKNKTVGDDITLWSAQYFKGHLETDPRCYVAQHGDFYAHGGSARGALRDLRFKIAQQDFNTDNAVRQIKERGAITFDEYRLLTGACESGLRQGLIDRGFPADTGEMPLADALKYSVGAFGGEEFARMMESVE